MSARRRGRPLLVRLVMAVAAVGLFVVGYQWGNQFQRARDGDPVLAGVLIRPPAPMPEVSLHAGSGATLDRTALADHWTLIAPASPAGAGGHLAVARLIEVANRLAGAPDLHGRLRLWLVSRDDVPALARDFERLTPALAVLTGDAGSLDRLAEVLGTDPAVADSAPESGDTAGVPPLYLIDPKARLVALFPPGQTPAAIAADIEALSRRPLPPDIPDDPDAPERAEH